MRATIILVALVAQVLSATVPQGAIADCGILGVMEVPGGVDPSEYRRCAEHPVKLLKGDLVAMAEGHDEATSKLSKRACRYGKSVGCSKDGWCYRKCCDVSGPWCWTAKGTHGTGDWLSCKKDFDCSYSAACGMSPGSTQCKECGCSC